MTMSNIREIALAAWEQRKQEMAWNDADKKRDMETRTRAVLAKLGIEAEYVDGNIVTVEDGVKLRRIDGDDWQVAGTCPTCGAAGWSPPVSDLAGIGQYLEEFRLDYGHACVRYASRDHDQPTAFDRLLAALGEWIDE